MGSLCQSALAFSPAGSAGLGGSGKATVPAPAACGCIGAQAKTLFGPSQRAAPIDARTDHRGAEAGARMEVEVTLRLGR
jgi:hypothetical protein